MIIKNEGCELVEVDFKSTGEVDDTGLTIKRSTLRECQHKHQSVDGDLRVIECRDCGATLDPVQVVLGWAKDWDRYAISVKHLRREKKRLTGDIAELKRELGNLKARKRRRLRAVPLG